FPTRYVHSFPTRRSSDLVWPKLPVKSADDGIAAELRDARCTRRAPQVNLTAVRTQAAGIGVAAEKVNFICKVVVELDANAVVLRSEEHTSELQSRFDLVC